MSYDNPKYYAHWRLVRAISNDLPGIVQKQILLNLEKKELHLVATKCRALTCMAKICLFTKLELPDEHSIHQLMQSHPDPDEFSGYIEILEIPGALTGPAANYVSRIMQGAHQLRTLRVDKKSRKDNRIGDSDPAVPYLPKVHNRISWLTAGGCSVKGRSSTGRIVQLEEELRSYPHLTSLKWCIVDPRIGTVQSVLHKIDKLYPDLKYMEIPWTDHLDSSRWDCGQLPALESLKMITFRFDHGAWINLPAFIRCVREFYERDIPVQVGSGCKVETALWLSEFYTGTWTYEYENAPDPIHIMHWLIQNNPTHLLKFTDFPANSPIEEAMHEAVRRVHPVVNCGLFMQISLTDKFIPDILLLGKCHHLRLVVTLQNIPPVFIHRIIMANPHLRNLIIALHMAQNGSSYHGNCTVNPNPIIPNQDFRRNSQLYTTPPFETVFRVRNKNKEQITTCWKLYSRSRTPAATAEKLHHLNMGWKTHTPDEASLKANDAWENEIKGWCSLSPGLDTVTVILNKDPQKFGNIEQYWCTDREQLYS
jgi:hypothetical protein